MISLHNSSCRFAWARYLHWLEFPRWQYCNFNLIQLGIPASPSSGSIIWLLFALSILFFALAGQLSFDCILFFLICCVHHWQVTDQSIAFCSPFLIRYRLLWVTDRLIYFVQICLPFSWAFCLQYYLFHVLAGGLFHFEKVSHQVMSLAFSAVSICSIKWLYY